MQNFAGFHADGTFEDVKFEKLAASGVYHQNTLRRLRREDNYFYLKIKSDLGKNQFEYELLEQSSPKDKAPSSKVVKKGVLRSFGKPTQIEIGGITYSCLTVPRKGDLPVSMKRPGDPIPGPRPSNPQPLREYVGEDAAGAGGASIGQ